MTIRWEGRTHKNSVVCLMAELQGSFTPFALIYAVRIPATVFYPPSIRSSAEVSRSSYLQVYCPWSSARTSAMVSLWTLCSTSVLCLPWGLRILPFLNHSDFTLGTENWHVMVQVWPSFKVTSCRCLSQAGSVGMTQYTFCSTSHAGMPNSKLMSQGFFFFFLISNSSLTDYS